MENYPGFEVQSKKRKNLTKIQILENPNTGIPTKIVLQKMCLLRSAEKAGDIEVVNNTQLGKLNYHGISYTKLPL
jgi:hypothetical protein